MTEEGNSPDWRSIVDAIREMISAADMMTHELSESGADMSVIAEYVSALHAVKADVSIVYDSACSSLSKAMNSVPEMVLSDGTKIEKRAAADRKKWQHENIAQNVASRISDMAVDLETGEVVMTPQDMMVKMLDYCAPSYWRVKELAKIGINADKFCDVSESKESIIVRRAK
jgi:hypothetical protein